MLENLLQPWSYLRYRDLLGAAARHPASGFVAVVLGGIVAWRVLTCL